MTNSGLCKVVSLGNFTTLTLAIHRQCLGRIDKAVGISGCAFDLPGLNCVLFYGPHQACDILGHNMIIMIAADHVPRARYKTLVLVDI